MSSNSQKTFFDYLIVEEFSSLGEAYVVANSSLKKGADVFELTPTQNGAVLILGVSQEKHLNFLPEHLIKTEDNKIVEAIKGLNPQVFPREAIYVLESSSACDLIKTTQYLMSEGLEIIDLRISKGRSKHVSFLTGNSGIELGTKNTTVVFSEVSEIAEKLKEQFFSY